METKMGDRNIYTEAAEYSNKTADSIPEFCASIGISVSGYYNLPKDVRDELEVSVGKRRKVIPHTRKAKFLAG